MFQLIVAVISIALVAALAAASIFYGGTAFSGSTGKANVTSLINQGQQIAGAGALYRSDNSGIPATDIATLVGDYLQSAPTPPAVAETAWDTDGNIAWVELTSAAGESTCEEVTNQNGDVSPVGTAAFDADTPAESSDVVNTVQYNCHTDGADTYTFVFKM